VRLAENRGNVAALLMARECATSAKQRQGQWRDYCYDALGVHSLAKNFASRPDASRAV
jgi:hypothetical protein